MEFKADKAEKNTLSVRDLQCVRGERLLFDNLSFTLESGKLLFVQGANGSGKTTLLRALCGLTYTTEGTISWNHQAIKSLAEDYSAEVLYIGHLGGIKEELTPAENLQFSVSLSGNVVSRARCVEALDRLGVAKCADLPTRVLSQGQKRRVALARLWLQDNPLWILDEPFTALDATTVEQLTRHIENFVNQGGMVVFTSHQEPNFPVAITQSLKLD